jgi:PIN domain nuclease of toxin-antitoxin system
VNLAEVIAKLVKRSPEPKMVLKMVSLLALPVVPWDEAWAYESRHYANLADAGLSFGDRACITEAMRRPGDTSRHGRPILEADRRNRREGRPDPLSFGIEARSGERAAPARGA